jgi:hypothetical protein
MEPRSYEVRGVHGRVWEWRLLPAGTELKRAFVAAILDRERMSRYCVCERGLRGPCRHGASRATSD